MSRHLVALMLSVLSVPAWAAQLDTVTPGCAALGAEVTIAGKGLRRLAYSLGGIGTLATRRTRNQVTILVPSGAPSGRSSIEASRGRKRLAIPFVVKGEEVCDGLDNDCNGLVDDIALGSDLRCRNGLLVLAHRDPTPIEPCDPRTIEACYTGPEATEGVGLCRAGARVCTSDGVFGPCDGEVVPAEEYPGNGIDEDCNGRDGPGGGELCIPGTLRTCYDGPPATRDLGLCRPGARMCDEAGFFGACEGQVVPVTEIPGNQIDEDCDGGDGTRAPLLDLVVNPVLSPTFQNSQVITGTVGTELAPPPDEPPPALVATVSPNSGRQGQVVQVTITGSNSAFEPGTTQATFGGGITVSALVVASPTSVVATLSIAPNASIGPRVVAVSTNRQEAIASNAFNVLPAAGAVRGKITAPDGAPVAGTQVCVSGTALCTTTAADGTFTIVGVPTNATRLIVTKAGFKEFSLPIGERSSDVDLGLLAFEDTGEPQPPPPQSGAPPLDPRIASVVARFNTTVPHLLTPEQARKTVKDLILLVGGDELGVLDASGAQLNPEITGNGPLSIADQGIDILARGFLQGATTTFEQWVFSLGLTFTWSGQPPDVDVMLARFQQRVDAAWADPDADESPLMISLFNPGPVFVALAPRLSRVTRISQVGTSILTAAVLIDGLERQTAQAPAAAPIALALRHDTMTDIPIVLAQLNPPPVRSFRQLTRSLPQFNDYITAINQAIVGTLLFSVPAAIAGGGLGVLTFVTAAVGAVSDFFLFQVLGRVLSASLAPTPPAIVSVEPVGSHVHIRVQRTEKDNPGFAAKAGPQLSRFNYTIYRGCQKGATRIVIANVTKPLAEDVPAGVFQVVDKNPIPGLNCYYADVIQNVGINIPPALNFATGAMALPTKIGVPVGNVISLFFISDLLSDFSVPSPFPMPGQPGAANEPAPTEDELNRTRTVWLPPIQEAFLGPYQFVDAVRADDTGSYFVSDSLAGTITKTTPARELTPFAATGFKGEQVGLAIDREAGLYTESVDSEARFSGRTFKFRQPDGRRSFTGTVDKYSPLLDRGNEVSVSALAIGPGIAPGLGDLFAAENAKRRVRRLPTSIIPPAGIEALPAPGHGIFGPLAASPIVGFPYVDLPTCERGRIADIDFDRDGTLFAVTDTALYGVPYDTGSQSAGELDTIASLGCGSGSVQVEVEGPEVLLVDASRFLAATGFPCGGQFQWSVDDATIVELGAATGGAGSSSISIKGKKAGTTTVRARYRTAQGEGTGSLEISVVSGPFVFVHGITSSAGMWEKVKSRLLQPSVFGADAFGGELCDNAALFHPRQLRRTCDTVRPGSFYTLNFLDNQGDYFDQGGELGRLIQRIKQVNDVERVTVIAHSMGGLASRAYIEGLGSGQPYLDDVEELITVDTPHMGSPIADFGQRPDAAFLLFTLQDVINVNVGFGLPGLQELAAFLRVLVPGHTPESPGMTQLQTTAGNLQILNAGSRDPRLLQAGSAHPTRFQAVVALATQAPVDRLCEALAILGGFPGVAQLTSGPAAEVCDFFKQSDLVVTTASQNINNVFPGLARIHNVEGHHTIVAPVPTDDPDFILSLMGATP